jgi:hypothetical protein
MELESFLIGFLSASLIIFLWPKIISFITGVFRGFRHDEI